MKLSVIMPVYNEQDKVVEAVRQVLAVALPENVEKEIVVVNDGSTDRTALHLETIADPRVTVYTLKQNRGKVFAVQYGIERSCGELIIIQDADLEYSPEHYPLLLEPVVNGQADVVYGSRFLGRIHGMTPVNRWANRVSTQTFNLLYGEKLTDIHTCLKLFKRNVLKNLELTSRGFSFDTELTCKLSRLKYSIVEKPVTYYARSKRQGKKITWADALETYIELFKIKMGL